MGGFEPKIPTVKIPEVEIPKDFSIPKFPDITMLNPHVSGGGLDQFAQNRALDKKMEVIPDLHFNAGARYTDITLAMGKKGGSNLPPEQWRTLDSSEGPFAQNVIRFSNGDTYLKVFLNLLSHQDDHQKLTTISWEGMSPDYGYLHHAASFGTINLIGSQSRINVEVISETERLGPDWDYFTLAVFTSNPLSPQSESPGGNEDFITEIKIHINNKHDAENLLQQFVKEYQKTGSAAATIDWLKKSPWGERILEMPSLFTEDRLNPASESSTNEVFHTALGALENGVFTSITEGVDLIKHISEEFVLDPARYPLFTVLPPDK